MPKIRFSPRLKRRRIITAAVAVALVLAAAVLCKRAVDLVGRPIAIALWILAIMCIGAFAKFFFSRVKCPECSGPVQRRGLRRGIYHHCAACDVLWFADETLRPANDKSWDIDFFDAD